MYSCKTSNRDDRCLVIKDRRQGNTSVVCEHHNCKEARAVMLNSGRSSDFTCQHIQSTLSATPPTSSYYNIPNLQEYQCGDSVKTELMSLEKFSGDLPLAVEVSPTVFCVFGPVTSNTPAGYCHVQVKRDTIRCCSKDCKTIIAKEKKHKAKNTCIHVHILISLGVMLSHKEASASAHVACEPTHAGAPTSTAGSSCHVYERGIASTAHSYYALGAADMPSEKLILRAISDVRITEKLRKVVVVIWDEASMSSARMLELANSTRTNQRYF